MNYWETNGGYQGMERLIASINALKPRQQKAICLPKDGIVDNITQLLDNEWFVKKVITETEHDLVLLLER